MKITKAVTFVAKEEKVAKLKALLTTMIDASRNETGCLLYNIYQREDDPKTFVVIETWANEEALEGHKHSAHYLHYKANYEAVTADKHSLNLLALGDEEE